jgi:hypothetical protein
LLIIINGKNELDPFNKSCKNTDMSFSYGKKHSDHISPSLAASDSPNTSVVIGGRKRT